MTTTERERLRATLRHVYDDVPHNRRAFDEACVHPEGCRQLGDLALFPSTSMLAMIDEFQAQGMDPRSSSLQVGIFGGEPWTEQMRQEMAEPAGCPAERREPAAAEVCAAVKDTVGVTVDVAVVDPDTLPRSVGKLKRLIDQRERA